MHFVLLYVWTLNYLNNFQKIMLLKSLCQNMAQISKFDIPKRSFFGWFNAAFNKYDSTRVAEVGIDRAAAEWILRCGGGVRWSSGSKVLRDYNSLPVGKNGQKKIAEIEGSDSCIMEDGFEHLKGLVDLWKITLVNNKYLTDESINFMVSHTKNRLRWLHLAGNGNITDSGLLHLKRLEHLEYLKLENLHEAKNPENVLKELQLKMPNCKIEFPPYTVKEEEID